MGNAIGFIPYERVGGVGFIVSIYFKGNMICFPNAKINIGLNVVRRREDGYHDLETLFYPLQLSDALEVVPSTGGTELHLSGLPIPSSLEGNLVLKALHLLEGERSIPPLDIYLHKVIPMGAGLGGGSSDGAFMLKLLNDFSHLNLSKEALADYARALGADCSFFLSNQPTFASGIGDVLSPINLSLKNFYLILVKPPVEVSTREAYSKVIPRRSNFPLQEMTTLPIEEWKGKVKNDFEESVFPLYPQIERIKEELYEMGAVYASMSGSGSSVFGIFREKPNREGRFEGCFLWEEKLKY